ncbi:flavin-containing monooxygenase [Pseudonocardia spinosispora]|uniref:flavin-containing monooxygenase n=1 Tax=Pseudonocardia spinosispora TaxID=103441 RepID=UPI0004101EAB|nr:NAD(P)/FAD-dependent oxidoreductase [Pseudonocardia spinosispora]
MRVVIIGAGFGGIAAAIELRKHGFDDLTILESAPELGGTWYYNTYPGAACDVPSHFYSYSFAQRRDWTRLCSPQPEILDYLRGVVADHGLDKHIVTDRKVTSCHWDDQTCRWTVRATDSSGAESSYEAESVVLATGQLNQPAMPKLDGLDGFTGHSFHSARWDHDYDLRGKRVAVVGTGASAVQFVPEIAKEVAELRVFQRSGNWFLPRHHKMYPKWVKALIKVPGVQAVRRTMLFRYMESLTAAIRNPTTIGRFVGRRSARFMRNQLTDPEVRRKAWPDYTFGCKRVLFSSEYLPALQRENVELITEAITRVEPSGPVTEDGRTHEVDCIIYGTGFKTNDFMFPMDITGTEGRSLRDVWSGGAHAHLGLTVPGFPSMFLLYGPNTNTSGGSIIFFLERQVGYLRQALSRVRDSGAAAIDVRPEVEAASDREVQSRFAGTAWTMCDSWYRNENGRVIANWPNYMKDYGERTRTLNPDDFTLVRAPIPAGSSA